MELKELYGVLEDATAQAKEGFEHQFDEITSLVEDDQFDQAVPLIQALFKEGTVDIRLAMYLLYAQYLEKGFSYLKDIFQGIISILDKYWEKLSPDQSREVHVISSLSWFLSSIHRRTKRSDEFFKREKKIDDFQMRAAKSLTPQGIKEFQTAAERLAAFLEKKLNNKSLNKDYIFSIRGWVNSLAPLLDDEKKEKPHKEDKRTDKKPDSTLKNAPATLDKKKIPSGEVSLQQLMTSEPMLLLLKKIETFEALIEQKNFEKAALVSDDISSIIKNFDPTQFFPKLFIRYFALTATHIDTLSENLAHKESSRWEFLNHLYKADIEEFIQW